MTTVTSELDQPQTSSLAEQQLRMAKWFTVPSHILLAFIVIFPLIMQLYVSLTWWTPLDGEPWYNAYLSWNWFDNYIEIFRDDGLWASIYRTLLFVAICVPLEFALGLLLAMAFYEKVPMQRVLYSVILVPMMVVPAIAGYIFYLIFQQTGPLNMLLSYVYPGAMEINWLNNVTRSFISIIIADVWQWTPLMFLILYAGLMSVPEDQMKAAALLRASGWQRFRLIAFPRMKAVMIIAVALRLIECLKIFDPIFVMTKGGPGVATESVSLYLYKRTFADLEWSYVAAIGLAILVFLSVIAGIILARSAKAAAAKAV
ncbi:MAG: carbohydrate ABC transporter permease [Rhizobiaceae bacterium]